MDRIEMIRKTFHNEYTGHLPVGFWHHFLPDEMVDGLANPGYVEQNLAGTKLFRDTFDPDFVKVMTDGLFFMPYNYEEMDSASRLAQLRPTEDMDRYMDVSVKFAQDVRDIYGRDVLMFYNVFSPAFQINNRMRQTHPDEYEFTGPIVELIKEDPEAVRAALELIADQTEILLDRIVGAGIMDGMYLSVSCFDRGIPEDVYRAYVAPSEERIIAKANSLAPDNILHICGWRGNRNNLDVYRDYDCNVINWAVHAEGVGLKEGKEFFHGKCVIGGFGNGAEDLLCVGSKEDIQNYVEKIAGEVGTTGVIIGCDCTTHLDTPDEHLKWVKEKADEIAARGTTRKTITYPVK